MPIVLVHKGVRVILSTYFQRTPRSSVAPIVCLCGSTRFKAAFEDANRAETLAGRVVLSVGVFGHADAECLSEHDKGKLDALHLRKIDLADEVLVINVGGYIGESTRREIAYAESRAKDVRYLEDLATAVNATDPQPAGRSSPAAVLAQSP